jgi:hypothetical protein
MFLRLCCLRLYKIQRSVSHLGYVCSCEHYVLILIVASACESSWKDVKILFIINVLWFDCLVDVMLVVRSALSCVLWDINGVVSKCSRCGLSSAT